MIGREGFGRFVPRSRLRAERFRYFRRGGRVLVRIRRRARRSPLHSRLSLLRLRVLRFHPAFPFERPDPLAVLRRERARGRLRALAVGVGSVGPLQEIRERRQTAFDAFFRFCRARVRRRELGGGDAAAPLGVARLKPLLFPLRVGFLRGLALEVPDLHSLVHVLLPLADGLQVAHHVLGVANRVERVFEPGAIRGVPPGLLRRRGERFRVGGHLRHGAHSRRSRGHDLGVAPVLVHVREVVHSLLAVQLARVNVVLVEARVGLLRGRELISPFLVDAPGVPGVRRVAGRAGSVGHQLGRGIGLLEVHHRAERERGGVRPRARPRGFLGKDDRSSHRTDRTFLPRKKRVERDQCALRGAVRRHRAARCTPPKTATTMRLTPGASTDSTPSNRDATSRGSTFARSENVSGADTFRISRPLTAR